jgi:cellulose synthase (UDP-forming)
MTTRFLIVRIVALLSVLLGVNYVVWRWLASVNWEAWWIAVPLVIAETYSLIDTVLFAITMWRARQRPAPTSAPTGTADVLITTYNEPVEMVMETARAATQITYPHSTWILDDGARPAMAAAARAEGIGYITRSQDWENKPRHAKAGNLNNALLQTDGEFLLILDADQVPYPSILDKTLGYFADDAQVALVQTPQWFVNVDDADPLGSQAPLFYGPIQQGKDGWNAAFFCGSNAVLRRDALMQLGIVGYVRSLEQSVVAALRAASRMLQRAAADRTAPPMSSRSWSSCAASSRRHAVPSSTANPSPRSPSRSTGRSMTHRAGSSSATSQESTPTSRRSASCRCSETRRSRPSWWTSAAWTRSRSGSCHRSALSSRSTPFSRRCGWTDPARPSRCSRWPRSR